MPGYRYADSPLDLIVVTALCFGWFILASVLAVMAGFPAQPFSDAALIGVVLIEIVFGSLALGLIATMPFLFEYISAHFGLNTANLAIGGTGLLIVVSVALETLRQINSRALMVTYDEY